MMFGYATNETDSFMPLPLELSHLLLRELAAIRKAGRQMKNLRPDSKSQVTIEYDENNRPKAINAIVISTQHDEFAAENTMLKKIKDDIINILIPRVKKQLPKHIQTLFNNKIKYHINPTGKFVIGGPHGDTGLTGRKIIVDTYGGKGAHGGGAFSGKDPSKVDRSAAYATRHIAKNLVAAGVCDEVLVQVAYAIGVAKPVGLYVNTYGSSKVKLNDGQIAQKLMSIKKFDMRPYFIEQRFKLRTPIYTETASYGHMGRKTETVTKVFIDGSGNKKSVKVKLFPWEELDGVKDIKKVFGL
jgi:S-adenosylmethionine synthetase